MNAERVGQAYLQRQKKYSNQCGVHALNNLLGRRVFNSDDMDKIIKENKKSLINPKHVLGGDYDISVLILALNTRGYQVNWLDNRKRKDSCLRIKDNNLRRSVAGYLINKDVKGGCFAQSFKNFLGFSGKHWFCVRNRGGNSWLLDSKLEKAEEIDCLATFIEIQMEKGSHVMEVFEEEKPPFGDTMDSEQ